jgi:peptide/nickel transport system substrate-binding protein
MVLSARDDYYLGTPKIKKVIYRAVPESASRLALLLSGTVDVAEDLSSEELAKVRASKGVRDLFWPRGSRFAALMMNLAVKPFNDVRIRQAMAYATPYEDIVKSVYLGRARPMRTIFPSNYPYATSRFNPYHTDYDKARALLKAAGYSKGFSTTLSYNAAVPEEERLAILMRTALGKVGIRLSLQKLPPAVFFTKLQGKEFPFVVFLDQPICPNPGYALFLYYVTKSLVNYTNYSNKEVDRLVLRGLGGSLNPNFQRRVWYQVQQLVLRDCPWVWVAEQGFHLAARSNVHGATWYPINDIQFRDFRKT